MIAELRADLPFEVAGFVCNEGCGTGIDIPFPQERRFLRIVLEVGCYEVVVPVKQISGLYSSGHTQLQFIITDQPPFDTHGYRKLEVLVLQFLDGIAAEIAQVGIVGDQIAIRTRAAVEGVGVEVLAQSIQ